MNVYVVADDAGRDAGFVGEQLENRGAVLTMIERSDQHQFAELLDPTMIVLLGSHLSAHEPAHADVVAAEEKLVRDALANGAPIMAICYGSQILARALGGTSKRAPKPELGWHAVETTDDVLCPAGPWPQLHKDVFETPPTAHLIGTSAIGPQSFIDESLGARAIGWQFHPEATAERFIGWIEQDAEYYASCGADIEALREETHSREADNRRAAHQLTDAALNSLIPGG